MKTLLILMVFAFTINVYAQQPAKNNDSKEPVKKEKEMKKEVKHWCPKCDYSSNKVGKCPNHKTDLIKEGTYYCKMHESETSDKPGKCGKCGMDLARMENKPAKKEEVKTNKPEENPKKK